MNTDTESNYVVNVVYETSATDGTYTASKTNVAFFEIKLDNPNYVPYANLTNDIVMSWVKEQLGAEAVIGFQNNLDAIIEAKKNPPQRPQNTPLPFNV
jgi:hypothetical protein